MYTKFSLFLATVFLLLSFTACKTAGDSKTETGSPTTKEVETKPAITADAKDKEAVKKATKHLFEVALAGDFSQAASLLAYRGKDKSRAWKSACKYKNEEEKAYVNKVCAKIQVILEGLKSHTYTEFIQEKEREGTWNVWVLDLKYEDGNEAQKAFAFLKIGGKYLLGDID